MTVMKRTRALSLKDVIAAVLSEQPDRTAVERLVTDSHRIALAYLHQKVRRGSLQPVLFGVSLDDLALDCFADLFQRDGKGRFDLIRNYFESVSWEEMNAEELGIALRRLIFTKVNEGLFRRYHEVDPGLAKIIRNVKDAVKADPGLFLVRHKKRLWLVVGTEGTAINSLPIVPFETLEAYLTTKLCRSQKLSKAVSAFVDFIGERPYYCNAYPVSSFSQALQAAFTYIDDAGGEEQAEAEFLQSEVQKAIAVATRAVEKNMYRTYVAQEKVDASTFDAYFRTVRDILAARFINGFAPVTSYWEALRAHLPDVSKTLYHDRHRHILEYLVKLSQARFVHYLRSEM